MKISDYLFIVGTWLLSSFTFSSSDVEFKNIKEEQGTYYIQFGVVGHNQASKIEVESILIQMTGYEVIKVIHQNDNFILRMSSTVQPNFHVFRKVFSSYGYEMDNRFFKIHNQELLEEVVNKLKKLRKDSLQKIKTQGTK